MKKLNKKRSVKIVENALTVIPFLLVLAILSRTIPDGTIRLNIGDSGIGEKAVALTFDDGPSGYTEELLDGLAQYNAKATFFVVGKTAQKMPEVVKRAHEEGHLIGNHTYSHLDFYKSSLSEIKKDIGKGAKVIQDITGEKPLFLRAAPEEAQGAPRRMGKEMQIKPEKRRAAGGVIPVQDYDFLYKAGVAAIFGPGTRIPYSAIKMMEILNSAE